MAETVLSKLENLSTGNNDNQTNKPERCLLFEIPAELRIEIYEHALRQSPAVIVLDLREDHQRQQSNNDKLDALTLTCKQIHKETFKIRYRVNALHIFAPVFIPHPNNPSVEIRSRGAIVEKLQRLCTRQERTRQLTKVLIFLGRLASLGSLRWMDFFMRWNAVLPVVRALRECVPDLRVSFEARVGREEVMKFEFGVKERGDAERGVGGDRRGLELTEREGERLGKVRATILKTLFVSGV